jgi:hypothetical protein
MDGPTVEFVFERRSDQLTYLPCGMISLLWLSLMHTLRLLPIVISRKHFSGLDIFNSLQPNPFIFDLFLEIIYSKFLS